MKKASFEARDEDERACEKEVVERARAAACVVGQDGTFATPLRHRGAQEDALNSPRPNVAYTLTSPHLTAIVFSATQCGGASK